jgi:hypothetical protein
MLVVMEGSSIASLGNMGRNRVMPTPMAVIAGCTVVIEREFVVFR